MFFRQFFHLTLKSHGGEKEKEERDAKTLVESLSNHKVVQPLVKATSIETITAQSSA
jgi:hypothetical protein